MSLHPDNVLIDIRSGLTTTWGALPEVEIPAPAAVVVPDSFAAFPYVAEHARTGALARDLGVHRVVAVGETARPVADGAAGGGTETTWVPDVGAAEELIRRDTRPGDVVLLKSSRDAGLRFLGDRVTGRTDTAPTEAPSC